MASRKRAVMIGCDRNRPSVAGVVIYTRPGPLVLTRDREDHDVIVQPADQRAAEQAAGEEATRSRRTSCSPCSLRRTACRSELRSAERKGLGDQVDVSEAALRYQERQTATDPAGRSESPRDDRTAAGKRRRISTSRSSRSRGARRCLKAGAISNQDLDQARTNSAVATARVTRRPSRWSPHALRSRSRSRRPNRSRCAAAACSRRSAERRGSAQTTKADVRLAYSEIRAPIAGIVDVAAARAGES